MADLTDYAQPAVDELLQADEDQLYEELAVRVQAVTTDPSKAGTFAPEVTYDAEAMGPLDELRKFGTRFFNKLNAEAYELTCGTDAEDSAERQKVLGSFRLGAGAVAAALAALLVAHLGIAPAIAAVVAALIIKLFFRPAYDALCETWKENVPQPAT